VEGYPIGYGGWDMEAAVFHDNTALDTKYGFNIDSLVNHGVRIERNNIVHPRKYGIVVGGGGTYANFKILNNTLRLDKSGSIGLIFQGNVTGAIIAGNKILADSSSAADATAINSRGASQQVGANTGNIFQSNQIAGGMKIVFADARQNSQNCFFNNREEKGGTLKGLPDNHNGPCVPADPSQPAQ
jgi:hypothetical protein